MQTGKQVIIHTGFHKTASSSIQHSLAHNRNLLETHGFHYPDFLVEGKKFFNRSIPLSGYYMERPENFSHYWLHNQVDHHKVNGLIQEFLDREIYQYDMVVFSDEFISTLNRKSLERIKNDFKLKGYRIRIISYVREPYNLLVSAVQQKSKDMSIERILQTSNGQTPTRKIRRLKGVFGSDAEFHSFEKTCQHENGPVGFFFDLLQIKLSSDDTLRINEGISNQASRLSSYINQKMPLQISNTQINSRRRRFDLSQIYKIRGEKFGLTSREARKMIPNIDKARSGISDQLGNDFLPEPEITFIPEQIVWNETQLDDLINISENLDLHILSLVYKYLLDLDKKSAVACPEKAAQFYEIARTRLHGQNVKDKNTIRDKLRSFVFMTTGR